MESIKPMEARQRRMELRRQNTSKSLQKRYREEDTIDDDDDRSFCSSSSKDNSTTSTFSVAGSQSPNKKHKVSEVTSSNTDADLSIYRGIKKQARYEPTIPISSKAELAAWRKEARRIRNRESAAASRNKTRERIDELEEQLSKMQNQYSTALQRIVELESQLVRQGKSEAVQTPLQTLSLTDSSTNHVSPVLVPSKPTQEPTELNISLPANEDIINSETDLLIWSPDHQSAAEALAKSLMYDITPSYNVPSVVAPDHPLQVPQSKNNVAEILTRKSIASSSSSSDALNTSHQNLKISRPTAVCVVSI